MGALKVFLALLSFFCVAIYVISTTKTFSQVIFGVMTERVVEVYGLPVQLEQAQESQVFVL